VSNNLARQWTTFRLGNVCTKIGSGATPRGGSGVYLERGEVALIRSQNVYNDGFHPDGLVYLTEKHADELANVEVSKGDILLNITGDSVARACQVDPEVLPARVNQHVAIIRPDPDQLCPLFLRYYLVSPSMQSHMLSLAGAGATRNALTKGMIESFEVPAPECVIEQRAIACILGTLDDKIELNRRRNRTLEALARAIFQSWFVDFDPVKAKAAVRREHPRWTNAQVSRAACPKLKPEIAELFPDRFEDSPLGPIPAGWRVGKVRELCVKVENGGTPKRQIAEYWTPAELPWLTSGEVRQPFVVETKNFISKSGFESSSAKMWPPFTTVVALYGATAGIATLLGMELCANQACCGLVPKDFASCFIHQLLSSELVSLQQQARGSAQQNLSQSIVADFPCLIPPPELLQAFENQVHCLYQRCIKGIQESRTLAALRDALLPKLISGELRVPDAERIVGRAV
jgi:type I restriction enzyme S subunit